MADVRSNEVTEKQVDLRRVLHETRTIAVVGCSGRPTRTSYAISRYLIQEGYTVVPVNPNYSEVHGLTCYPDLPSIPDDVEIDMVNVFRNARYAEEVVREVAEFGRQRGKMPIVWTQIGVSTPAVAALAQELGIAYVANRCIMVEHSRYF